jgi:lysophospholipase L1-like esterase
MYVDVYEDIWAHRDLTLMEDGTHLTAAGHERIAAKIISVLKQG